MVEEFKNANLYKGVHAVDLEELYTSGHRTCQGCESALVMRDFVKASGPRTVVTGATGCMYVANTSYMTTPWIVPWMHTQLAAGGASAVGMAAGLKALMRKGRIPKEKINVINFSGDLGAGDEGLGGLSGAMQSPYDLLVIVYDNESAANTSTSTSLTASATASVPVINSSRSNTDFCSCLTTILFHHSLLERLWSLNLGNSASLSRYRTWHESFLALLVFCPLDVILRILLVQDVR